jgi:hypothetical protein
LISSIGFSQDYTGKVGAYIPDEDKTYIMESISESEDEDGNYYATFNNVAFEIEGDVSGEVLDANPSYRPQWKWNKRREVIDTPTRHVECVLGGNLCVVILAD